MSDWLIICRLGSTQLFFARNCTRETAIGWVENAMDMEFDDDLHGDYVEICEIPAGNCVEIESDVLD